MNRTILAALVAVALLAAGGVFLVLIVEREPPVPAVPAAPGASTPPAPESGLAAALGPRPAAPLPEPTTAPTEPPLRASPAVELQRRAKDFASMRREVVQGLTNLDSRVLGCGLRSPQMMLTLESQDGNVRVVRARVQQPGPEEFPEGARLPPERPEAMECAVRAVEGALLYAPSAKPGRQWEMAYTPGVMQ